MCELFLSKWVIDNFHSELAGAIWKVGSFRGNNQGEARAWWNERGKARVKKEKNSKIFFLKNILRVNHNYFMQIIILGLGLNLFTDNCILIKTFILLDMFNMLICFWNTYFSIFPCFIKYLYTVIFQSAWLLEQSSTGILKSTVKPLYNDHPRDPKFVTVVDRWSLFRV